MLHKQATDRHSSVTTIHARHKFHLGQEALADNARENLDCQSTLTASCHDWQSDGTLTTRIWHCSRCGHTLRRADTALAALADKVRKNWDCQNSERWQRAPSLADTVLETHIPLRIAGQKHTRIGDGPWTLVSSRLLTTQERTETERVMERWLKLHIDIAAFEQQRDVVLLCFNDLLVYN